MISNQGLDGPLRIVLPLAMNRVYASPRFSVTSQVHPCKMYRSVLIGSGGLEDVGYTFQLDTFEVLGFPGFQWYTVSAATHCCHLLQGL